MNKYFIFLIVSVVVIASALLWHNTQNNGIAASLPIQSSTQTLSQAPITPGPTPQFSCPAQSQGPAVVTVLKTSGISTHKINGVSDYVIAKGSKGSIVFAESSIGFIQTGKGTAQVAYKSSSTSNQIYNISFYHQAQVIESYNISQINTTNQSRKYKLCGSIPTVGTICKYQSTKTMPHSTNVYVTSLNHQGISSHSSKNSAGNQNVTLNTNSTTQSGTYWITLGGNPCNGGELALLTIGNSAYNGTVSNLTTYG